MSLTINEGTQTDVYSLVNGGTEIPVVKLDVGNGTAIQDYGAIGGQVGLRHPDRWSVAANTGTSTLGTLRAAVAGSVIYLTDIVISGTAATNVEIGDGGTANLLLGTLYLGAAGGMVANFVDPISTTSGSALVYKQSANTGLSIMARGYID